MTLYFYHAEPTDQELKELRSPRRLPQYTGLFTNQYEFNTFNELKEAREARVKAELEAAIVAVLEDTTPVRIAVDVSGGDEDSDDSDEDEDSDAATECDSKEGKNPFGKLAAGAKITWCEDQDLPACRPMAQLYSPYTLNGIEDNLDANYRDESTRKQLKSRFDKMREKRWERKLAELPAEWVDKFDALTSRYPNFISVIQHVRIECQLAALSNPRVVRLPPMLLCGPPGIGKTVFALDFAKLFACGFFTVSMENAQHGSALCGSSRYWSNSKTGLVFDALVDNDHINPVILVDEIDKASTDSRNNPLAPLYQLLEQKQAAAFCDLSIPDLPIDASHITWMFTANDIEFVPQPIVNRMRVFHVPSPTLEQGKTIVATLFREEIESIRQTIDDADALRRLGCFEITPDIIALLTSISVRQAKICVRRAIANALANQADKLHVSDLIDLTELHIEKGVSGAH